MSSLTDTIEQLLWDDESASLDFKEMQYPLSDATDDQKSEIIKDVLAFANAFRRGEAYIILGAKDVQGGRAIITGVTHHLDDARLQQLVNSKTNRPADFTYHAVAIDGKQVGAIRIPLQKRPIYLLKPFGKLQAQTVYIRHGSSTATATPDEIAGMGANVAGRELLTDSLALAHRASHFYKRVERLINDINDLPYHQITNISRPPEYEVAKRALRLSFDDDYQNFETTMRTARELLASHDDLAPLLEAMKDVQETVEQLRRTSYEQFAVDHKLPRDHARDAAEKLSALLRQHLSA
jgi:hypothetical protein